MKLDRPRLIIAGTGSGSGKTTVTAGILRCLRDRGIKTASFKCGPDYIDPMFHSRITGRPGGTLDPFFCGRDTLKYIMAYESADCDMAVAEGVMGYYDGIGFSSEASTYDVARAVEAPALLVVGCKGMGASAEAVLKGFLEYAEGDSMIRGVIFNNISSRLAPKAIETAEKMGIRVYGYLPPDRRLTLESRHLGLVTAGEVKNFDEKVRLLASTLEKTIDIDGIIEMARGAKSLEFEAPAELAPEPFAQGTRIAVSRDRAFNFIYRENIEMLQRMGCEVVFFSPVDDNRLPKNIDGLMLSGGYPEIYAGSLSINESMRESIRSAVENGLPTIAECGGFMYLHSILEGQDGARYPMAGIIEGSCADSGALGRFGYVTLTAKKDGLLGPAGSKMKAHEFHYWDSTSPGDEFEAVKPDGSRRWTCGFHTETMYAGFPHFHFASCPEACRRFVLKCMKKN
ncbi:MAG: cobyrinate a,c-diamide synthase [Anaerovoracaceae bacterium]|nr:cobyrinate a,c-diamide synthase [Bacillota bacterium]MDY2670898.1 cobyrinate a,c-diamide synthase [Anaerovoracaceae bacterium]